MRRKANVSRGSGNVFADIGVACPERVKARAEVMARVAQLIHHRGLTQKQAAHVLGIPQSKVSCLMNGKLKMFSLDHLFQLLNALDNDVSISIKQKTHHEARAHTRVLLEIGA